MDITEAILIVEEDGRELRLAEEEFFRRVVQGIKKKYQRFWASLFS